MKPSVSTAKLVLPMLVMLALGALSAHRASAAPVLYFAGQSCVDREVTLSFRWEALAPDAQQAWIDLAMSDSDWANPAVDHIDVTTASDSKVDWPGRASRSYYYARLNQQLSDGSWESSTAVGFETQQCGRGPLGTPPELLGFSAGPFPNIKALVPPDGTLNRSCGPDHIYAYMTIQTGALAFAPLTSYRWYIDGRLQPIPTPAGYGNKNNLVLLITVDSVPAQNGPYAGTASITFPNADPVASASVNLTCS